MSVVPNVQMQIELKGPENFHEPAMYAKRADTVLVRISSQDSSRKWQTPNTNKGGKFQHSFQARPSRGPKPMEIATIKRRLLTNKEK